MKKATLSVFMVFVFTVVYCQQTYYWIGGASRSWNNGANWNTSLNGSGSMRPASSAGNTDILVFDGSNIGGSTPATGAVTADITSPDDFGGLKLQNNANVTLSKSNAGPVVLTMNGDNNTATLDFVVPALSQLSLSGNNGVQLNPVATVTGQVNGSVTFTGSFSNTGSDGHKLTAPPNAAKAIIFKTGSIFTENLSGASADNPFGSISASNAASYDNIVFEKGATYNFNAGKNPFALNAPASLVSFQPGSNFNVNTGTAISLGNRTYGNLFVNNNNSTQGAPVRIDTILVKSGVTFTINSSGVFPIYGSIILNGDVNINAPPTFLLAGNQPQTITGNGKFGVSGANGAGGLNNIIIGSEADVTLDRNLTLNPSTAQTSVVAGTLRLGTNTITGNSLSTFTVQNATTQNLTGNFTTNSISVTNIAGGSVDVGMLVSGAGILPHTVVTSVSGTTATLSFPATATASGAAFTASFGTGTLSTNNPNGLNGALQNFAAINLSNSGSYTFNTATSTPFPISVASVVANNLTINAPITLNKDVTLNGSLTLNNKLTVPATNQLLLNTGASIGNASATNYVVTSVNNANGNMGLLRINNIAAATLFPVGSASYYLPVTISPAVASDFAVTVFEGVTQNGMPNGTPYSSSEKQSMVDAVWNISRANGSGNATLTTNWPQALEGSVFSSQSNIGIQHYDNGAWGPVMGSGNNSTNTATATFNSFSPFVVAVNPTPLPVHWTDVSATFINGKINVEWKMASEQQVSKYEVERSVNKNDFSVIGSVAAKNNGSENAYSLTDATPAPVNYYRVKSVSLTGEAKYSNVLKVVTAKSALQVYPNPADDVLSISGLSSKSVMTIYNAAGNSVKRLQPAVNASAVSVSISTLPKGLYVLQIVTDGNVETKTFVKQ